jgi:hypothetical protein
MSAPVGPPVAELADRQRFLLATAFWLILDSGTAVPAARLAAAAGLPAGQVEADLVTLARAGRIRRDDDGAVLGSLGLTMISTCHRVRVGTAVRHTWCALDAVGILGALAADGRIESENPDTGQRFGIDFAAGLPTGHDPAWVLFVAARVVVDSVIDQWCPRVRFFADSASAREWAAARQIAGEPMRLLAATEFGAGLWRRSLAAAPRPA